MIRWIPALVAVLAAAWLASKLAPRGGDGAFDVQAFARLPVVYQGRVKPFDTLARNSLTVISDRQTWRDADDERRPAVEWLLDVMSGSPRAGTHKVFRIHNHELLTQLGLERRPGYRYAFDEFAGRLGEVESQAMHASRLEREQRDVYDMKVLEFWHHVTLFRALAEGHALPPLADDPHGGLFEIAARLDRLSGIALPHPVYDDGEWKPLLAAIVDGGMAGRMNPAARSLVGILSSWAAGDPGSFNEHVSGYAAQLADDPPPDTGALGFEVAFNRFAPFYHLAVLYVVALAISCLAWLGWTEVLRRTAFWLLATTFVVHTLAIAARIYISGYPPITNLYGTAVFIGWACVLLGLFLEWIYKLDAGNLLSATAGFFTLLIAHFLAGDGDTLEMMQAVLDTKFWLATHVVIINFGYSATFLAGGLSGLYILRGVFTRTLDAPTDKALGRMIYGVLCFALLLSFVGTVLGGLWADDSWGRFWGWDPKENGALMIVLWNALILHARFGGIVQTRGIANLAVFGNVITAWSWFGVNQLGVGLHSYGFTDSVTFWLLIFVASQVALIGIGLVPRRYWRSPGGLAARSGGDGADSPRKAAEGRGEDTA